MKLLHNTNFMHFLYEIYVTALRAPMDNRLLSEHLKEQTWAFRLNKGVCRLCFCLLHLPALRTEGLALEASAKKLLYGR